MLGMFCVGTYPRKVCVTADGILGKMLPSLGKMKPILVIYTKSGQKFTRIGEGKFNHGMFAFCRK